MICSRDIKATGLFSVTNIVIFYEGRVPEYEDLVIETCDHPDGLTYTINDTHHTSHCKYCLYSLTEEHHIPQVTNVCDECGYGEEVTRYSVGVFMVRNVDEGVIYEGSNYQTVADKPYTLPECRNIPEGYEFAGWMAVDNANAPEGFEAQEGEILYSEGFGGDIEAVAQGELDATGVVVLHLSEHHAVAVEGETVDAAIEEIVACQFCVALDSRGSAALHHLPGRLVLAIVFFHLSGLSLPNLLIFNSLTPHPQPLPASGGGELLLTNLVIRGER